MASHGRPLNSDSAEPFRGQVRSPFRAFLRGVHAPAVAMGGALVRVDTLAAERASCPRGYDHHPHACTYRTRGLVLLCR